MLVEWLDILDCIGRNLKKRKIKKKRQRSPSGGSCVLCHVSVFYWLT